jgi:hypothetical protein
MRRWRCLEGRGEIKSPTGSLFYWFFCYLHVELFDWINIEDFVNKIWDCILNAFYIIYLIFHINLFIETFNEFLENFKYNSINYDK